MSIKYTDIITSLIMAIIALLIIIMLLAFGGAVTESSIKTSIKSTGSFNIDGQGYYCSSIVPAQPE